MKCSRASMTPLPIWLSTQGILVSSTKRRSMLDVILRFAPAPITRSGCLHACAQKKENDLFMLSSQLRADQTPGPPQEGQLRCRLSEKHAPAHKMFTLFPRWHHLCSVIGEEAVNLGFELA